MARPYCCVWLRSHEPFLNSIVALSLDVIAKDLSITNAIEKPLVLSIFFLGFGIGPLLTSPQSEIYGRTLILQLSNAMFIVIKRWRWFRRDQRPAHYFAVSIRSVW